MTDFELTAEERRKVQFTVDQLERLRPAIEASYDDLADVLERFQQWSHDTEPEDDVYQEVGKRAGIVALYSVSFKLIDYFQVLSGGRNLIDRAA